MVYSCFVVAAYERCKRRHDYLVVEGTSLRDGSNTAPLNALLASTMGCPTLLVNDAHSAALNRAELHVRHHCCALGSFCTVLSCRRLLHSALTAFTPKVLPFILSPGTCEL